MAERTAGLRPGSLVWRCGEQYSAFEASDECYAVGNAVDELKKIASGIILSNEEDGVARWLIEHAVV